MKRKLLGYLSILMVLCVVLISTQLFGDRSHELIDSFFNALIEGEASQLNPLFAKGYFESTDIKAGYSDFAPQKITNIKVSKLSKSTGELKAYEVVFEITDNSAPPFIIAGSGELTYFFTLIKEEDEWKIKGIATSP